MLKGQHILRGRRGGQTESLCDTFAVRLIGHVKLAFRNIVSHSTESIDNYLFWNFTQRNTERLGVREKVFRVAVEFHMSALAQPAHDFIHAARRDADLWRMSRHKY